MSEEPKTEEKPAEKPPVDDKVKEIMELTIKMLEGAIDTETLTNWLKNRDWEIVLGRAWAHLDTPEKKAKMLTHFAKCDMFPKAKKKGFGPKGA